MEVIAVARKFSLMHVHAPFACSMHPAAFAMKHSYISNGRVSYRLVISPQGVISTDQGCPHQANVTLGPCTCVWACKEIFSTRPLGLMLSSSGRRGERISAGGLTACGLATRVLGLTFSGSRAGLAQDDNRRVDQCALNAACNYIHHFTTTTDQRAVQCATATSPAHPAPALRHNPAPLPCPLTAISSSPRRRCLEGAIAITEC